MKIKQQLKSFPWFFFILGLYFLIVGAFPVKVEIIPTETEIRAHIHRKAMFPPLKNIDTTVHNLKQAIVIESKDSKGRTIYEVALEDFQGRLFPIEALFSSGHRQNVMLQKKINNSIKNKTAITHSINQDSITAFGFVFILASIISFITDKNKNKNKSNKEQPRTNEPSEKKPKEYQSLQDFLQPPKTESEDKKYKNINDSIIK